MIKLLPPKKKKNDQAKLDSQLSCAMVQWAQLGGLGSVPEISLEDLMVTDDMWRI